MSPAGPAASPLLRIMPGLFVLIWSTGYIVAKFGVPYAEPFTFLALRFIFSIAVLLAVALVTGAPWPRTWAETGHALVSGVLIHGLYLGGVWWAIARGLPAGIAALIVGLQPLLTALMARRMLGEAMRPAQWLGILAGFLGVGLVLAPKLAGDALAAASLAAVAATLAATLAFTLGTFYQKRFLTG
ncbi:MAG: EamA family transporter, partial [Pseudomonadota bacterium]|nr:EamA family transporter [Pseudomonadota bacterium]